MWVHRVGAGVWGYEYGEAVSVGRKWGKCGAEVG